jgi:hypothetical protein
MATIAKNRTKKIKQLLDRAESFRIYTLGNQFRGDDITRQHFEAELMNAKSRHNTLALDTKPRGVQGDVEVLTLHLNSNHWLEATLKRDGFQANAQLREKLTVFKLELERGDTTRARAPQPDKLRLEVMRDTLTNIMRDARDIMLIADTKTFLKTLGTLLAASENTQTELSNQDASEVAVKEEASETLFARISRNLQQGGDFKDAKEALSEMTSAWASAHLAKSEFASTVDKVVREYLRQLDDDVTEAKTALLRAVARTETNANALLKMISAGDEVERNNVEDFSIFENARAVKLALLRYNIARHTARRAQSLSLFFVKGDS